MNMCVCNVFPYIHRLPRKCRTALPCWLFLNKADIVLFRIHTMFRIIFLIFFILLECLITKKFFNILTSCNFATAPTLQQELNGIIYILLSIVYYIGLFAPFPLNFVFSIDSFTFLATSFEILVFSEPR